MCAATCSMWWLGWILHKTTQLERSYQSGGTWSTGAALVSPSTKGKKKKKKIRPCDIPTKTSTEPCTDGGRGCSFLFFSLLSLSASAFFGRQPHLTKLQSKQSGVNTGWTMGKHGLLWRVWWVTDRVWWTFLILSLWCYFFFLPGEMFWEAWTPTQGSPVEPWQPNKWLPLLLTVTFDLRALSCPAERGCLRSLPGSITSFPPEQLKRLAV